MKAPPFDTIEARKRLYDAVAAIPGVNEERRLTGRPSFPMAGLAVGENLEQFIRILDDAVDQMLKSHDARAYAEHDKEWRVFGDPSGDHQASQAPLARQPESN